MDPATTFCPIWRVPPEDTPARATFASTRARPSASCARSAPRRSAQRKAQPYYRLRTSAETVSLVVTLLAHGCPRQAIVVGFGFDERTVACWLARAGVRGQAVQDTWWSTRATSAMCKPMTYGAKTGWLVKLIVWVVLDLMVGPTLVVRWRSQCPARDTLIQRLIERVRRCALPRPLLS